MGRASSTVVLLLVHWLLAKQSQVHTLLQCQSALTSATTSNAESEAPAGTNSNAERVRQVKHELRRGRPPGHDHPVWNYFSVYVKEA